jgi:hypothetical protein
VLLVVFASRYDVKAEVLEAVENMFLWAEVTDYCLYYRRFGIRGEGKLVQMDRTLLWRDPTSRFGVK